MQHVRLLREINQPGACGPINGQYALQRALRRRALGWLTIGGSLRPGEIPWFWCWQDREVAAACAAVGRPFIVGPNVLFEDSRRPCRVPAEREVCNAASCRLIFTESEWYRDLIEQYVYKYHFKTYPVVQEGELIGCVSTRAIQDVPRDQWAERSVGSLARQCSLDNTIAPTADAMEALSRMSRTRNSRLMVVDGERLVGMIALKDLLSFLSLKLKLEG